MGREDDVGLYEAMTIKMEQLGYRDEPIVDEDTEVARDLLGFLEWRERAPLEERIGNAREMVEHLRTRPLTEVAWLARQELELLETLRRLEEWGEELANREEPDGFAEELAYSVERCTFEDTLFAATEEFFGLLDRLDEEFPV